jgi:hypothetical protein
LLGFLALEMIEFNPTPDSCARASTTQIQRKLQIKVSQIHDQEGPLSSIKPGNTFLTFFFNESDGLKLVAIRLPGNLDFPLEWKNVSEAWNFILTSKYLLVTLATELSKLNVLQISSQRRLCETERNRAANYGT